MDLYTTHKTTQQCTSASLSSIVWSNEMLPRKITSHFMQLSTFYVFITAIDVDTIINYSHTLTWPDPTHAEAGNARLSRTGAYVVTDFKMEVG